MAFTEVSVVQVREALRRWLNGDGERPIAIQASFTLSDTAIEMTEATAEGTTSATLPTDPANPTRRRHGREVVPCFW